MGEKEDMEYASEEEKGLKQGSVGYTDIPTLEDYLEIDSYYDGFKEFIECCQTPLTMAIQGDWGSGKTSALKLIERKIDPKETDEHGFPTADSLVASEKNFLEGNQKCHVIWFNTWQYAHFGKESNLTLALLAHLADELKKHLMKDVDKKKFKDVAKDALKGAVHIGAKVWFQQNDIDAIYEKLGEIFEAIRTDGKFHFVTQDILDLKNQLQQIILKIPDGKRLVIFVDDLDRLDPKEAVDLLEGIKCFMDCPNCVFVLAIDEKVVNQGLSSKYGSSMDEKKKEMFFDKIIQIPFYIPTQRYNIKKYLENSFLKDKIDDASAAKTYIDKYVYTIQKLVGNNPRSIKRIFNLWELNKRVERITDETDCYNMFVLLTVQVVAKKRYDALVRDAIEKSSEEFFDSLCVREDEEMPIGTENDEKGKYADIGHLLVLPDTRFQELVEKQAAIQERMEDQNSISREEEEQYVEDDRKIKEWYQIRALLVNTNRMDIESHNRNISSFSAHVKQLIEVLKEAGYACPEVYFDNCEFKEKGERMVSVSFERLPSKASKTNAEAAFYEKLTIYNRKDSVESFKKKCDKLNGYGFRKAIPKDYSSYIITNVDKLDFESLKKAFIVMEILPE